MTREEIEATAATYFEYTLGINPTPYTGRVPVEKVARFKSNAEFFWWFTTEMKKICNVR